MEWARAFILVLCALTPAAAHADEDDVEDDDVPSTAYRPDHTNPAPSDW